MSDKELKLKRSFNSSLSGVFWLSLVAIASEVMVRFVPEEPQEPGSFDISSHSGYRVLTWIFLIGAAICAIGAAGFWVSLFLQRKKFKPPAE